MSDFQTQKVAFAIAMFAVILTITPVLGEIGRYGLQLGAIFVPIRHVYFVVLILLAAAVYAHAIRFLVQRPLRGVLVIADCAYAIAVLIPIVYLFSGAMYAAAESLSTVRDASGQMIAPVSDSLSRWSIILLAAIAVVLFYRQQLRQRPSLLADLDRKQILGLESAKILYERQDYPAVVRTAWDVCCLASQRVAVTEGSFGLKERVVALRHAIRGTELVALLERLEMLKAQADEDSAAVGTIEAEHAITDAATIVSNVLRGVQLQGVVARYMELRPKVRRLTRAST